jgi:oxygen-dependent protoporphyrinogen oxidase
LEASQKAGGVISTVHRNGFIFEGGPQCPRFPEPVWKLVRDLSLEHEFVVGDPKAKRFILREGHLHRVPFSAQSLLSTSLVSVKSKYRIFSEAFRNSQPPAMEESLAEFVERKFGPEVLDYLIDPFISTIFFSDARKMGMQSAFPALVEWERTRGSVARGAIRAYKSKQATGSSQTSPTRARTNSGTMVVTDALPSLGSFRRGMGTLVQTLSEKLREHLRFSAKVESATTAAALNDGGRSGWRLRLSRGEEIFADTLIVALPSYGAAALFEESAPKLSSLLNTIEHSSLAVVALAYNRNQVRHPLDGFGFMAPQCEGLRTICTFWNSSLFPGRAPDRQVLMTSFARRQANSDLYEASDESLARTIEAENAKILGISGATMDREVWQYQQALPQYNVGHVQTVAQIRQSLAESPGLYLAGNYLTGRSIGDCTEAGYQAAENLRSNLGS